MTSSPRARWRREQRCRPSVKLRSKERRKVRAQRMDRTGKRLNQETRWRNHSREKKYRSRPTLVETFQKSAERTRKHILSLYNSCQEILYYRKDFHHRAKHA